MDAGAFDTPCEFRKRLPRADKAGNKLTNEFFKYLGVMAQFRPVTGSEQASQGRLENVTQAILRVRATPRTEQISSSHRVWLKSKDWAIKAVSPRNRKTGLIEINIESKDAG